MENYLTCGQVARKLHVSISTLKRWASEPGLKLNELRNHNGWRLFSEDQVNALKEFKRRLKRNGKRFNQETLLPIESVIGEAVFDQSSTGM
jgi:DNA-binding transcriptional MerR regulator